MTDDWTTQRWECERCGWVWPRDGAPTECGGTLVDVAGGRARIEPEGEQ